MTSFWVHVTQSKGPSAILKGWFGMLHHPVLGCEECPLGIGMQKEKNKIKY